jgi:hypothetical protein
VAAAWQSGTYLNDMLMVSVDWPKPHTKKASTLGLIAVVFVSSPDGAMYPQAVQIERAGGRKASRRLSPVHDVCCSKPRSVHSTVHSPAQPRNSPGDRLQGCAGVGQLDGTCQLLRSWSAQQHTASRNNKYMCCLTTHASTAPAQAAG